MDGSGGASAPTWLTWVRSVPFVIIGLGLAWAAAAFSLSQRASQRSAQSAYAFAPWDSRGKARYARSLITANASAAQIEEARTLARSALRQDPTAIDAVVSLGIVAQLANDTVTARRYFAYADRLSHRDLQVHFWAIEDAVQRKDITEAVKRYDIALRTSRNAPEVLFPILASAIKEPEVRAALVSRLRAKPSWAQDFFFYAAGNAGDPRAVASLFEELKRERITTSVAADSVLVDSLISAGAIEPAWKFYKTVRPGADRRRSRDADFSADLSSRSRFDWQVFSGKGLSASIASDGSNGRVLTFSATSGSEGLVLRQVELLVPGKYRLVGKGSSGALPVSELPYWQLSCLDGRDLLRVPLGTSQSGGADFAGVAEVSRDCPVQYISLFVQPTSAGGGVEGEVRSVAIEAVQ